MAPLVFDHDRIQRFLEAAGSRLAGEWLLVGGAAAAMWFNVDRTTEDIDLLGLDGTANERLSLMELASAENLPIESVNSAADFFVRRVVDWRDQLEVLLRGSAATIYRPNPTLFCLLKCTRLSESDLSDCLALIDFVDERDLTLDRERLKTALSGLTVTEDVALLTRRQTLLSALFP